MEKTKKTRTPPKQPPREDVAATYDEFKEFEGRKYTGMKIGRGHKWHYDQGTWTETKITPEEWKVEYNVTKRRAGKAHAPRIAASSSFSDLRSPRLPILARSAQKLLHMRGGYSASKDPLGNHPNLV